MATRRKRDLSWYHVSEEAHSPLLYLKGIRCNLRIRITREQSLSGLCSFELQSNTYRRPIQGQLMSCSTLLHSQPRSRLQAYPSKVNRKYSELSCNITGSLWSFISGGLLFITELPVVVHRRRAAILFDATKQKLSQHYLIFFAE